MPRLSKPHLRLPIRRTAAPRADEKVLTRGQIIVLFALMLTVMILIMGLAIDISFAWLSEMRIQKATDSAALAGAVYLPDDSDTGINRSLLAAQANGYSDGIGGVHVTAVQHTGNPEQMDVTISAPVPTFFLRIMGISSLTATRVSHAQFHLPVPMGSPLNVFGFPSALDLQGQPLNFWAAINAPCTYKNQGDPYATKVITSNPPSNCSSVTTPTNTEYKEPSVNDPGAYDYAVKVIDPGTVTVALYDPEFCPRSQNQDTGDTDWQSSVFDTVFTLYSDPNGTPYDLSDDSQLATTTYPGGTSHSLPDGPCSTKYMASGSDADSYVAKWITFTTFAGAANTTYRLNVQTKTNGSSNAYATNQFSIRATIPAVTNQPQVYAGLAGSQSAMSVYNNIPSGNASLYLAKINATFVGKTLEVDLFDPGEVNGNAYLSFWYPSSATAYSQATFSWRNAGTTLGTGGTVTSNVTQVQTSNGSGLFDGQWLVVTIKIPSDYTAPQNGWWKIKYSMAGTAHDRTTWRVTIVDSPVHLVG